MTSAGWRSVCCVLHSAIPTVPYSREHLVTRHRYVLMLEFLNPTIRTCSLQRNACKDRRKVLRSIEIAKVRWKTS